MRRCVAATTNNENERFFKSEGGRRASCNKVQRARQRIDFIITKAFAPRLYGKDTAAAFVRRASDVCAGGREANGRGMRGYERV